MFRAAFLASTILGAIVGGQPPGYDVYVLWFQSNMIGRYGPIDGVLDATNPRIEMFGYDSQTVSIAADPLDHVDEGPNTVGPGLSFAKAALAELAPNRKILLVTVAKGATGYSNSYWVEGGTGDVQALARVAAAMSQGTGVNRLMGILGTGGETDYLMSKAAFIAHQEAQITRWRSTMAGASATTPWVFGGLLPGGLYTADPIVEALKETPSRVFHTAYAPSTGLVSGGDNVHTSAAGMRTMGARFYTALLEARANSAAAVPGAVTDLEAAVGDGQVVLSWTAPAFNHSAISDYIIEYKLAASGTWLTFGDGVSATPGAIVTGLTNGIAYNFRNKTVNGIGTGAVSNVVTQTPEVSGPSLPYAANWDTLVDPSTATMYQGITAAGSPAVLAADPVGYIEDVSPANFDWKAPAATGVRPTIGISSGVVSLVFDGTDDYIRGVADTDLGAYDAGLCTLVFGMKCNPAAFACLFSEGDSASSNDIYAYREGGASVNNLEARFINVAGSQLAVSGEITAGATFPPYPLDNVYRVLVINDTGTALQAYVDGYKQNARTYARSGTFSMNRVALMALIRNSMSSWMAGELQFFGALLGQTLTDGAVANGVKAAGEVGQLTTYVGLKQGRTL